RRAGPPAPATRRAPRARRVPVLRVPGGVASRQRADHGRRRRGPAPRVDRREGTLDRVARTDRHRLAGGHLVAGDRTGRDARCHGGAPRRVPLVAVVSTTSLLVAAWLIGRSTRSQLT